MARYSLYSQSAPTISCFARITGTSNRELVVDYLSAGIVTTTNVIGRVSFSRVTTDGTTTAQTPEKFNSRSPAFHGTVGITATADPSVTGSALIYLSTTTNPRRYGKWSPPRPNAGIHLIDVERIALFKTGTTAAQAFSISFRDTLTEPTAFRRVPKRARHRSGFLLANRSNQLRNGAAPTSQIIYNHRYFDYRYWIEQPDWIFGNKRLALTESGAAPIQGSVTFHAPITTSIAAQKIGLGSTRVQTPIVARTTGTKIGLGSVRAQVPIVARTTGTKIGLGSTRMVEPIVVFATGAPVSNIVQGSVRALLAIVGRITGTKLASGSALFEDSIVVRTTQTKIGLGSTRVILPIIERDTGTKIGLSSTRIIVPIVTRNSGIKIGQTSVAFHVDNVGRFSGTKTLAQGTARFIVDNILRATGSKIALGGTTRAATGIIVLASGTGGSAVQGNVRALVPIIVRVSGVKLASGNLRAPVSVIARTMGSKSVSGSSTFFVDNVVRSTGRKIASGFSQFEVPIVGRSTGIKTASGSSKFILPNHFRTIGSKLAQGSMRGIVTIWFYSTNIVGDPVIVQVSIRVEDLARLRIAPGEGLIVQEVPGIYIIPDDGLIVTEIDNPLVRVDQDSYRSIGVIKSTEVRSV
jgi:hypothetical protein